MGKYLASVLRIPSLWVSWVSASRYAIPCQTPEPNHLISNQRLYPKRKHAFVDAARLLGIFQPPGLDPRPSPNRPSAAQSTKRSASSGLTSPQSWVRSRKCRWKSSSVPYIPKRHWSGILAIAALNIWEIRVSLGGFGKGLSHPCWLLIHETWIFFPWSPWFLHGSSPGMKRSTCLLNGELALPHSISKGILLDRVQTVMFARKNGRREIKTYYYYKGDISCINANNLSK